MLLNEKLRVGAILCLTLLVAGCADNPGTWPQDKLAKHVQESLVQQGIEVTNVTLIPKEGGGYEGTAEVADGETLQLIVTQDPAARRLTWDAKGDRGSFLDGFYELK